MRGRIAALRMTVRQARLLTHMQMDKKLLLAA